MCWYQKSNGLWQVRAVILNRASLGARYAYALQTKGQKVPQHDYFCRLLILTLLKFPIPNFTCDTE